MIQAQSADGVIHQFPDGTDPAVVDKAMKDYAHTASMKAPSVTVDQMRAFAKPPPLTPLGYAAGLAANFNRGTGIGDELAAGANTAINAVTGRLDPHGLVEDFKSSMAKQRQNEDAYDARHPNLAALSRGTGMATVSALPASDTAGLMASSPRMVNMARGATTAGLTAAGYAAADRGTPQERLSAAEEAARNPVVLGLGAMTGALGPSAAGRAPKPKISQDVVDLRAHGVQLTPGQAKGGIAKAAEDAYTSTPILGTAIQQARSAGLETYNHAVANDVLSPVGIKVPEDLPAGHQTVAYVQDKLGHLYDTVIPTGQVAADGAFKEAVGHRLSEIAQDMTPAGKARLADILDNRVTSRFSGGEPITGETFQRIHGELGTAAARFNGSQDADQRAIGEALGAVQEELRSAAARQNPEFAAKKAAIDQSYARFKRMQGAAASVGSEGGIFTPAQYGGAVRRGDRTLDKGATARGEALGQDLADAGRAVLPSRIPNSGTADRGSWAMVGSAPGAIITGAMTGGPVGAGTVAAGYGMTLGGLKLASKAYSPEAISAANRALDVRISAQQQDAAMRELMQLAKSDPAVAKLYQDVAGRLTRAVGISGASMTGRPSATSGLPQPRQ